MTSLEAPITRRSRSIARPIGPAPQISADCPFLNPEAIMECHPIASGSTNTAALRSTVDGSGTQFIALTTVLSQKPPPGALRPMVETTAYSGKNSSGGKSNRLSSIGFPCHRSFPSKALKMPASFAELIEPPTPEASAARTAQLSCPLSAVHDCCSKQRLDRFSNSCKINVPQSQNSLIVCRTIWQELSADRPRRATSLLGLLIRS